MFYSCLFKHPKRRLFFFPFSLQICNLAILQARMEAQPYYSEGINSGPPLSETEDDDDDDDEERAEERGTASDDAAFDVSGSHQQDK